MTMARELNIAAQIQFLTHPKNNNWFSIKLLFCKYLANFSNYQKMQFTLIYIHGRLTHTTFKNKRGTFLQIQKSFSKMTFPIMEVISCWF